MIVINLITCPKFLLGFSEMLWFSNVYQNRSVAFVFLERVVNENGTVRWVQSPGDKIYNYKMHKI